MKPTAESSGIPSGTPNPGSLPPEARSLSWNTTMPLGPTVVHIHVAVPDGATCSADLKTSSYSGNEGHGPTHFLALDAGKGYGMAWGSQGEQFRVHAPGFDTQSLSLLPTENGYSMTNLGFKNLTMSRGIDAYVAANLTPWPKDIPPVKGSDWSDKSLAFSYSCDQPAKIEVGAGYESILIDAWNAMGGAGVHTYGYTVRTFDLEANDQVQAHLDAPNVTVFASAFRDTATVLQVHAPHSSPQWTFLPQGLTSEHFYKLDDGPGDYGITVSHANPGSFSYILAVLGTAPVAGLDALLAQAVKG
jgi:hypothetical protein